MSAIEKSPVIGKHILSTLTIGMYQDPRMIYREYIQNSADQIDTLSEDELQDKIFVYKVVNGKTESAMITVFPIDDGKEYIVESGLQKGDTIIAEGAGLLREGIEVTMR